MRHQSSRPKFVSFCEQVCCALLLLAPTCVVAVCKESLQSEDLLQLDAMADADPVATIATANRLLAAAADDPQRRTELYAIIADANNTLSNDEGSLAALKAGRQSLAAMSASELRERIALRFELVEADTSQGQSQLEAAIHRLQDWESRLKAGSLGQACLRLVRSRVRGRLSQHELAAEDGLTAHALTVQLQVGDAQSEAAIQLATTFRRAGMAEQALPYVDEAIQYTQANKQLAALSLALFTKAQILGEAKKHQDALYIAQQSRELSINLKDEVGRAFSDHEICVNRHELSELGQAESACRAAIATFRRQGRVDQALISEERLARITLSGSRHAEALRIADAVLAADPIDLPPALLPRLHFTRSEALRLQGSRPKHWMHWASFTN